MLAKNTSPEKGAPSNSVRFCYTIRMSFFLPQPEELDFDEMSAERRHQARMAEMFDEEDEGEYEDEPCEVCGNYSCVCDDLYPESYENGREDRYLDAHMESMLMGE